MIRGKLCMKAQTEKPEVVAMVLDALDQPAAWLDESGRLRRVNQAFRALCGGARDRLKPGLTLAGLADAFAACGYQVADSVPVLDGGTAWSWRRSDGAGLDFKAKAILAAGGYLLICMVADAAPGADAATAAARFRSVAANLPGAVFRRVRDRQGRVTYPFLSAGVREIYGYDPAHFTANPDRFLDSLHPEDRVRLEVALENSMNTLAPVDIDLRIKTRAGTYRWIRSISRPTRGDDGVTIWDGVILDIDDQKKIEAEVNRQKRLLQSVIDVIPAAISFKDREGRYRLVNEAQERLVGKSASMLIGHKLSELFDSQDAEKIDAWDREVMTSNSPIPMQPHPGMNFGEGFLQDDREQRSWIFCKVPVGGEEGKVEGVVSVIMDVTDQVRAESDLHERETQLETIIDNMPGAVFRRELSPAGKVSYPVFRTGQPGLFCFNPEDAESDAGVVKAAMHPDDVAWVSSHLRWSAETLAPSDYEVRNCSPSGEVRWYRVMSNPLKRSDGTIYWDGIALHITDQKQAELQAEQQRKLLETIVDMVPALINVKDAEGRFLFVNKMQAEINGMSPADHIGRTQDDLNPGPFADMVAALDRQVFKGGQSLPFKEYQIAGNRDGNLRTWWITKMPMLNDQGVADRIVTVGLDISRLKRAQEKIRLSEERYALVVKASNEGIFDWDPKTDEIHASARFHQVLGLDLGEDEIAVTGQLFIGLLHAEDRAGYQGALEDHLAGRSDLLDHEIRVDSGDGSYRWVRIRGVALRDEQGVAYRLTGSLADITEQKNAEQQLRFQAYYDELTGLPNRTYFVEALEESLEMQAYDPEAASGVLIIDIDRFSTINDSLGHRAGDALLKAFGDRLRELVDAESIVARLGGDEFGILGPGAARANDLEQLAQGILERQTQPLQIGTRDVYVSVSIGIALSDKENVSADEVIRNADAALYRVKLGGKSNYRVFDRDMRERAVRRLALETDLRRALPREEHSLNFQPIIALADGRISGCEALIRWHHPVDGMISPVEFIPVAEETGQIAAIGRWALGAACREVEIWGRTIGNRSPLQMSVNVSGRQFTEQNLVEDIAWVLQETKILPEQLKLEITESVLMDNPDRAQTVLRELKALGLMLAIDDFGTGYSSMSYLQRFPFDTLKIDRAFVHGMSENPQNLEIVKVIIALATTLGMSVTAEGIESQADLALLRDLGCTYGQGYLFSPPVQAAEIFPLLERDPVW